MLRMARPTAPKMTIAFPQGMIREMESIMSIEQSWLSAQEFIRDAIKEKIERWKRDHPPKA